MITGMHAMFYSSEATELRAFLRDKLGLAARDVGGGWLIFDFTQADMGVHPTDFPGAPASGTHAVSFHCTDFAATFATLQERGVVFDGEPKDEGYGMSARFTMPGGVRAEIYEPGY